MGSVQSKHIVSHYCIVGVKHVNHIAIDNIDIRHTVYEIYIEQVNKEVNKEFYLSLMLSLG